MAQIQSPETYADGQQVTASRLNNQTNGAVLLPGAVTDQTALASNTVASGDQVILHDASATALRKATAGDLLGSGLPITTGAITGSTGADLVLTPAAGQKVDIAGNIEVDDITVTDDATIAGDLIVTGGSTLTGNVIADNGFTSNGVANFTGTLQVNGAVGYVLTEISEESIASWTAPSAGNHFSVFTSAAFTKPAGEIWAFELVYNWTGSVGAGGAAVAGRYGSVTQGTGAYLFHDFYFDSQGGATVYRNTVVQRWIALSATTFTSETFRVDANSSAGVGLQLFNTTTSGLTTSVTSSKFRIYKYKTA